jgi:hypothetical protein
MVPCLPSLDWDPYSMLCTVHYFGKPHLDWKYGIILYGLYHQSGQLTWHTFPSLLLHQPSNPKAQHIAWTPRYLLGLVSLFLSSEKPQIFFLVKKKVIGSSVIVLIVGIWLALCVECTWRWIRACYYNKFTRTISVYYSLLWHEMVVEDETVVEEYDPHERDVWFYSTRGPKLSINWSWLASSCFSLFTYLFRRVVVVVCVFS